MPSVTIDKADDYVQRLDGLGQFYVELLIK